MTRWLDERESDDLSIRYKVLRTLHEEETPYQKVEVVETAPFGRALLLDGVIQTTEWDEHIYHEMIAHVPLFAHPNPERVLVIGGGDGGVIREVIKHSAVKVAHLVEIDKRVTELSKQYLPDIASGLFDRRVRTYFEDGTNFVGRKRAAYDVILVDSSDPVGPAVDLFAEPFYRDVYAALRPGGLFAAQTGSPYFHAERIAEVVGWVAARFPHTAFYLASVPTYSVAPWGFTVGSRRTPPERPVRLTEHVRTKHYSAAIHRAAFALPRAVEETVIGGQLADERRTGSDG